MNHPYIPYIIHIGLESHIWVIIILGYPIYPIYLPRIFHRIPGAQRCIRCSPLRALADQRRRGHLRGAAEAAEHRGLERHVHVVPGTTNWSGVGATSVASYESIIYIMYIYIYINI